MSSEELKPCPFCGGDVSFHKDEECPGCHLIQCGQCRAFFDFATGADPGNDCESVDALRSAIAPMWNRRAQLAAIQGGMGEVVEVAAWLHFGDASRLLCDLGKQRSVPGDYAAEFNIPLMTVAQHQRITAAMAAEVERLKLLERVLDDVRAERDELVEAYCALRAELAEVKGQEAVAYVTGYYGGRCVVEPMNQAAVLPARMALYAHPPASPDVEGLVNELQRIAEKCSDPDTTDALDTALSTWRQAQEGKP